MNDPQLATEAEGAICDLIDMIYSGEMLPAEFPRCAIPGQPHDPNVKGHPDDCPWCIVAEVRARLTVAAAESQR